jgi:glycerol-3-phosphate acyltransferase PlsY
MMPAMNSSAWVSIAIAYGLGCVSFAALAARLKGVDIRAQGSGNPGATNVGRVLGQSWGAVVLALDILKGAVPVWLLSAPVQELASGLVGRPFLSDPEGRVLLLTAAVLGHTFPISSRFRGGKGVATLLGGLLALDPVLAAVAILAHAALKRGLGFVSVASVVLVWVPPLFQLVGQQLSWQGRFLDGTAPLIFLAALITLRHRDNFTRIRQGVEDRYDDRDDTVYSKAV